ncbi:ABC transporter permease [Streptomyces sp. 71268]|uniref:ABC transporter permease n=1 Tax=Streptomyces sp. 71268 TaxID=3002640 RepID=UPI0023F71AFC|nr:ABC transporter permease [Streptomyces sp. 71268]WEV26333.1 ABC transporter permease [Streptomyces sp. 71268]
MSQPLAHPEPAPAPARRRARAGRRRPASNSAASDRATFWHSLRAEWVKIRTMRSTLFVILGALAFAVGLAALNGSSAGDEYPDLSPADRAEFDPLETSLMGYLVAQIAFGLLGGLVMTSEYGARTIVPTLTSVPRRARVLGSKALVLVGVALPVGIVVSLGAFLVGQAALSGAGAPHLALSDGAATRGVLGGGLYLTLAALLGLALGAVIRSTTATVTTLFGVMLIVRAFAPALPGALGDGVAKFWPPLAGGRIITAVRDPDALAPWAGLGVMAGCVAALLAAAFVVFRGRDA